VTQTLTRTPVFPECKVSDVLNFTQTDTQQRKYSQTFKTFTGEEKFGQIWHRRTFQDFEWKKCACSYIRHLQHESVESKCSF